MPSPNKYTYWSCRAKPYQTFVCKNTKKERLNQLYYVNLHKYILKK